MWLDRFFGKQSNDRDATGDRSPVQGDSYDQHQYELVSAEVVDRIALEVVDPSALGFELLKRRMWAKQAVTGIVQLISLRAAKGAAYVFTWGVSLDFVPHEWDPKPKFHRTLKSARYDLFEDAAEFIVRDPYSPESQEYLVEGLRGEDSLKISMKHAWNKLCPYLTTWFNTTSNLPGVLCKAQSHASHEWQSFRHFPDPKLIVAFTLARLGRMEEARLALKLIATEQPEQYGSNLLEVALQSVCPPDCLSGN